MQRKGADKSGGGGVAIILKTNFFSCKKIFAKHNVTSFEFIALELVSKRNSIPRAVVVIYRPPGKALTSGFLSEFQELCELIHDKYGNNLTFTGDFNIHVNDQDHNSAWKFSQLLNDNGLMNHVNVPTFKRSNNILDLVIDSYTNPMVSEINVNTEISISDHHLIYFKLKIEREKILKTNKVINFREFNDQTREKGKTFLQNSFAEFSTISTVVLQALKLHNLLAFLLTFFPISTKTIKISEQNPWYSKECKLQKISLRKAERKLAISMRKPNSQKVKIEIERNQIKLKTERKVYMRVLNKAKGVYYSNIFSAASDNPKKTYRVISELLGQEEASLLPELAKLNPKLFVENFCDYLYNKIKDIRQNIEKSETAKKVFSYNIEYSPITTFAHLNDSEMTQIIKDCRRTCCPLDEIDFRKFDINILKPYFLKLTNTMFETGVFPKTEKSAIITPIIKDVNGDVNKFDNYRGISKVPMPGKIFESSIHYRMQQYIEVNRILPNLQSAYRKGYSTETALLKTYSDLIETKDVGRCTVMLSLDLSAAFDTIDHELLIADLFHMGFRGKVLDLISDYLRGRTFSVHMDGHTSEPRPLLFGVPQGSTLGPLLFTLYIRSLSNLLDEMKVNYHTYADDTIVYFDFDPNDIQQTKLRLADIMSKITAWMNSRRLKLNIGKTKLILFPTAKAKNHVVENFGFLDLQSQKLYPSTEVKVLGFILDMDLNFNSQINSVIRKCNFALFNLKHVRDLIPRKLFISVVMSEILSRIDYCNALYMGMPKYQLQRLQMTINKSVRLIYALPKSASITPYLKDRLHWLPIGPRIDFKFILLSYKVINSTGPNYLESYFRMVNNNRKTFFRPRIVGGHSFANRAFKYTAPAIWNKVPKELREIPKIDNFKKRLKSFLFEEGFTYKTDTILNYNPSSSDYTFNV